MKNIIVGGAAYGWKNIGDDGLLRGIINDFLDCNISVFTKKSEWLNTEYPQVKQEIIEDLFHKPRGGLWYGRRSSLSDWKKSLFPDGRPFKNKDLFVCGGGTILSACPWHSYKVSMIAKKNGVPTVLWGVGMCEEKNIENINLIRNWLNDIAVLKIYARDEIVRDRIIQLGVDKDKVSVCYDPAYILEPSPFNVSYLDESAFQLLNSNKKKIVLTLSGESDISQQVTLSVFKDFLSKLVKNDCCVFLIPISYGDHTKDRQFAEELEQVNPNVKYIRKEFHPCELIDFLSMVDMSISSRLHMSIYSAVAGIPFVALKRNDKNSDLAKLFDMPCLSFDNISVTDLNDVTNFVLNNKEDLSKSVKKIVLHYKEIHKKMSDEVKKMLEK